MGPAVAASCVAAVGICSAAILLGASAIDGRVAVVRMVFAVTSFGAAIGVCVAEVSAVIVCDRAIDVGDSAIGVDVAGVGGWCVVISVGVAAVRVDVDVICVSVAGTDIGVVVSAFVSLAFELLLQRLVLQLQVLVWLL